MPAGDLVLNNAWNGNVNAGGGALNCAGDYWPPSWMNPNVGWVYPYMYTYPTTTITISTTVTLYAKCGHCAKTEQSTGCLPVGWLALECGGVKQSLCSMKCVAEYAKAAAKK